MSDTTRIDELQKVPETLQDEILKEAGLPEEKSFLEQLNEMTQDEVDYLRIELMDKKEKMSVNHQIISNECMNIEKKLNDAKANVHDLSSRLHEKEIVKSKSLFTIRSINNRIKMADMMFWKKKNG